MVEVEFCTARTRLGFGNSTVLIHVHVADLRQYRELKERDDRALVGMAASCYLYCGNICVQLYAIAIRIAASVLVDAS